MKARNVLKRSTVVCALSLAVLSGLCSPGLAQNSPTIAGCPVLPHNNIWNTPIDTMPVDPNSSRYISSIGSDQGAHPDFGSGIWDGGPIGIPYNIVPGSQPKVAISFDYADESDPGPYPIPPNPAIEGGSQATGDRHVLVVDSDHCFLYETWSTYPLSDGTWQAGSGAVFDLQSNGLRPRTWTSSDAAGLPVLPGLVRYDEVAAGEINHTIRFTAPKTRKEFIWPARHCASSLTDKKYPPMGQRFRLKAGFDISGFAPEVQIILKALKKYGMILADNGAPWYLTGVPDARWNDDILVNQLRLVTGSNFEAVDESSLMLDPDSGQARSPSALDASPPDRPVRLIFVHHSTGENWLADGNGRLGIVLRDNNYFVSDTNYGWGPGGIGSTTDIGHWWLWFRGPNSSDILSALYGESNQHSSYTRMSGSPPGNENEVILFKSCFPNSALKGSPGDPAPAINENPLRGQDSGSSYHTVANAKEIYRDLLEYFATRQDKLFIAIAAPPLSDATYAANARAFNEWLVSDWLKDYPHKNVAVFDFYNVLTTNGGSSGVNDLGLATGNHHRWWQTAIQHKTDGDTDGNPNVLEYASTDDHPSTAGNLKATGEFPALLNVFYHCWQGNGGCPPGETSPDQPVILVTPPSHSFGNINVGNVSTFQTFTVANRGGDYLLLGTITLKGQDADQFSETYDGCSKQLVEAAADCAVDVVFAPTSAGAKSASLQIPSNDPLKPEVTLSLSGSGLQPKTLRVISPNGSEQWEAATSQTLRWTYTGNPGAYVKIQLLKNGTTVRTIASQTAIGSNGNGSYTWPIPAGQAQGSDYQIKVTSTKNASTSDTSDACFTINPTSITVTRPNGGENWQTGTTQLIQWTYTGNPGAYVRIQLLQGTALLRTIVNKTPMGSNKAGSFNWVLSSSLTPGNAFKVRVMSASNAEYKDESNAPFSIRK